MRVEAETAQSVRGVLCSIWQRAQRGPGPALGHTASKNGAGVHPDVELFEAPLTTLISLYNSGLPERIAWQFFLPHKGIGDDICTHGPVRED